MLAVYHLANHKCPLSDLAGIPEIVEKAGLMDVPQARVAVIDGNAHAPGQPWKHRKQQISTPWGELAWQLGGSDGFGLVKESDAAGTPPGEETLRELLAACVPCVVLIDELVAYIRQFPEGKTLTGGTYDSSLSFVQALTEAAKLVPNAIVLASLPESDVEGRKPARHRRSPGARENIRARAGPMEAHCYGGSIRDCAEAFVRAGTRSERARYRMPRLRRRLRRGRRESACGDAGETVLRPSGAGISDPS